MPDGSRSVRARAALPVVVLAGLAVAGTAFGMWMRPGPERRDAVIPSAARPAQPSARFIAARHFVGDAGSAADVTTVLQRFVDSAADGSLIWFEPGASYRLDCTIWIRNRRNLTFDGRGARFFVPPDADCPSQTMWRFNAGGGHVIRDMVLEGSHPVGGTYMPPREFQIGVESLGTSGLEVADLTIRDVMGDCVHLGLDNQPGGGEAWSEDVWIHGLDCARNGRQGIAVTGARRVLVERSVFTDQAYVVFDLEPDAPPGGASDVTIRDNVVAGRVDSPMLSIGGAGQVSDVVVEANRVIGGSNHGIWSVVDQHDEHRPGRILIRGNSADQPFTVPDSALFVVDGADDVTIEGNHQLIEAIPPLLLTTDDACRVVAIDNRPGGLVREGPPGTCG